MKLGRFKDIFTSLRSRNYRLYFAGQSISLIGTWMQNIAMSWLVYRLTDSVFLLGVVGFTNLFPTFIISPFAGVLTDRYNRHRIMVITQFFYMFHAGILAFLTLSGFIMVWHIILLSILFGFISAFDIPSRQSLVIDLVDKPGNLGNAIALNSAMFNGARLIGPGIAGIIVALVGEGVCFLINAISYITVIWALLSMNIKIKPRPETKMELKKSLTEGFKYTFGFQPFRVLLIWLGIVSLFGMPYTILLPAYAKEVLHGGSDTLGFLMSATGAGALTGALLLAARKSVLGLGKLITLTSVIFGCGLMVIAYLKAEFLSYPVLFITGFGMITSIASVNTLIQTLADEDKRGRVMGFYAMALMGVNPIGNLLAGINASFIGVSNTLFIGGIITVITGLWFEKRRPEFRKHTRPVYVRKGIIPEIAEGIQSATNINKQ